MLAVNVLGPTCDGVQEVVRTEGRTEAVVDEGIAVVVYALDDVCVLSVPWVT